MAQTILIIDDDLNMRWVLKKALAKAGYAVETAADGESGLFALVQGPVDLVVLDLKMPGVDGLGVLRQIKRRRPDLPVVLLTAHSTVPTAVEAMRLGAADYLRKPFDVEEIRYKIAHALERQALDEQVARLSNRRPAQPGFSTLVGATEVWLRLLEGAERAAASDRPLLVWGEPGAGTTALALAIQANSPRAGQPLEVVDGGLLSPDALREELLAEGGALARALGGSLLLDHAERLPADIQTDLGRQLALLVERGGALPAPRLIAIASAGPEATTPETLLQPDLGRLVSAIALRVPPLRERRDDLPLLLKHFAGAGTIGPAARAVLLDYDWPGNVRQLQGVVARALALAGDGPIELAHLPPAIVRAGEPDRPGQFELPPEGINLEAVERDLLRQALALARGNKAQAARLLGLSRHTLLYRLEKYGLGDETRSG
ncbi:MAG: sigma-54-dependent transcriptional regulator [Anaerolineae bacterium]